MCQEGQDHPHEKRSPPTYLRVEQQNASGLHCVVISIVRRDPVSMKSSLSRGDCESITSALRLENHLHQNEELASTRMIDTSITCKAKISYHLQNLKRAECITIEDVLRAFKAHCHMTLSDKIMDLKRLLVLDDPYQVSGVAEISVMKGQVGIDLTSILVEMIYPSSVETAHPPLEACTW